MEHNICTGDCGGVSSTPGVCNTESCAKHGQPLVACNCESEEHRTKLSGSSSDGENGQGTSPKEGEEGVDMQDPA